MEILKVLEKEEFKDIVSSGQFYLVEFWLRVGEIELHGDYSLDMEKKIKELGYNFESEYFNEQRRIYYKSFIKDCEGVRITVTLVKKVENENYN